MYQYFCALLVVLFTAGSLPAQDFNSGQVRNSGSLPADFTTPPYDKYEALLLDKGLSSTDVTHNQRDFYLEGTYVIDQLLRSGYVLYNDPIGDYLNEVLEVIVAANPELQEIAPRVYVLRTPEVNAFAVDQGMVFVSIGLLAQLEDEAQLAIILAHELAHIKEEHGLDGFLEEARIDRRTNNSRKERLSSEQFDLAAVEKNNYSREQEMSADELGLTYFLNSAYSFESIRRVFEVLRYSYLPFDEIPFELSTIERLGIEIPTDLLLEQVQEINPADEDEEMSTHPALSTRKQQFDQRLTGLESEGRVQYLVSEEKFKQAQFFSRGELLELNLQDQSLSEVLYLAFLLERHYGVSEYSRQSVCKGLYGWAKFKNNEALSSMNSPQAKDVEGQSQQVFHLMETLEAEQLSILAIANSYDLYRQQPENHILRRRMTDLFADLYQIHDIPDLTYFLFRPDKYEKAAEATEKEDGALGKIDRIRINLQRDTLAQWQKFAFSDVLQDTAFRNIANAGFDLGKARKAQIRERGNNRLLNLSDQSSDEVELKGYALGIDEVLLINPVFFQIEGRKQNARIAFQKSDDLQRALKETILESAATHEVEVQVLDVQELGATDADKLNDIIDATSWISNQMDVEDFPFISYNQEEIQKLAQRYGTPYIMSAIGISSGRNSLFSQLFQRHSPSFLMMVVLDVRTGHRTFIKANFFGNVLSPSFLKSELYDAFQQLSKK